MAVKKRKPKSDRIEQKIENAEGNIYQAGGNIHIESQAEQPKKSLTERWTVRLGLVIAALTIVSMLLDIPKKIGDLFTASSVRYYGTVVDAANQGVPEAEIFVLEKAGGDTIGVGKTLAKGDFNFIVKAKRESAVFIRVIKDNHVGFNAYKVLAAGDKIPFE